MPAFFGWLRAYGSFLPSPSRGRDGVVVQEVPRFPLSPCGRGWIGRGLRRVRGAFLLREASLRQTPHPPFGHLLPQGEKGERHIDAPGILHHGALDCGRDWPRASAEGATAPETLRPTDRSQVKHSGKQAFGPLRRSNRRSAGKSLRARTEGARIFRHRAEPCRVAFEPEWCPWPKPVPKTSSKPRSMSAM